MADADPKNRTTHYGSQPISSVRGLQDELQSKQDKDKKLAALSSATMLAHAPKGQIPVFHGEDHVTFHKIGIQPGDIGDIASSVAVMGGGGGGGISTTTGGMMVGLFAAASALLIPNGTDSVRTSGYSTLGKGVAEYVYDAAVDAAYVSANPRTSFISSNARGFKINPYQRFNATMFGVKADATTNDAPALLAALAYLYTLGGNYANASYIPSLDLPAGGIVVSQVIPLLQAVHVKGHGHGGNGGQGTWFMFPLGSNCFEMRAQGASLEGVYGSQPWVNGVTAEGEYHFIKIYYKCNIHDCGAESVQGDVVHCNITAGSGGDTEGNANNCSVRRIVASGARNAVWFQGADANAGFIDEINANGCRQFAGVDISFLGNGHGPHHAASCGLTGIAGIPVTASTYSGNRYCCIYGQEAWASTNSPSGTTADNQGWAYWQAGGVTTGCPAWSNGINCRAGGPYLFGNAHSTVINPYAEGDQALSQMGRAIIINGEFNTGSYGGYRMHGEFDGLHFNTPTTFDSVLTAVGIITGNSDITTAGGGFNAKSPDGTKLLQISTSNFDSTIKAGAFSSHNLNVYAAAFTFSGTSYDFQIGGVSKATLNSSGNLNVVGTVTGSNLSGTNTGDQFASTTASKLLGRGSASGGAAQEITLGTGLSMSGTTLNASGGSGYSVVSKTAGYTETATSGELVIKADLAAGFTIVLPTAVGNTAKITVKKMQAAGTITLDGAGTETIDGGLTADLTAQYQSVSLVSDNSGWIII